MKVNIFTLGHFYHSLGINYSQWKQTGNYHDENKLVTIHDENKLVWIINYSRWKQTGIFCLDINVKFVSFKKKTDLELFLTQNL